MWVLFNLQSQLEQKSSSKQTKILPLHKYYHNVDQKNILNFENEFTHNMRAFIKITHCLI